MMRSHLRLIRDAATGDFHRVHHTYHDDSAGAGTPPPAPVNRAQLAIPFSFALMAANSNVGSQLAHTNTWTFARDTSAGQGRVRP